MGWGLTRLKPMRRKGVNPRRNFFTSTQNYYVLCVIYMVFFTTLLREVVGYPQLIEDRGKESGIFVRWAPTAQAAADSAISFYKSWNAGFNRRQTTRFAITNIKIVPSQDARRRIDLYERMPRITLVVKGRALSIESAAPYLEEKVCKDYKRSGVEYGGYFNAVAVLAFDRDVLERLPYQDLIEITDMLKNVNFNSVYLTYLD